MFCASILITASLIGVARRKQTSSLALPIIHSSGGSFVPSHPAEYLIPLFFVLFGPDRSFKRVFTPDFHVQLGAF